MSYTPPKYIKPTDPEAFVDMELKQPAYGATKLCPKCKGYGEWNLTLNAYSMPDGYADTAENRSKYRHFRALCGHCSGWGYVMPDEMCPGHEWVFERNLGRCYNRYKCSVCGKHSDVDSSD